MNQIQYPYHIRMPRYLGKTIKNMRKKKHMTQENLADITGTSTKFISDIERGKETAQMDKVFDLLRALSLQVYVTTGLLPLEEDHGKTVDPLG